MQRKIVNIPVVCVKSLYKSTYKKNVFVNKKEYTITSEDDVFYYIVFDDERFPMNFSKENHGTYYYFFDYFKLK